MDLGAKQVVAAAFSDVQRACRAVRELHQAHFRRVWVGFTQSAHGDNGTPVIEAEWGDGPIEALAPLPDREAPTLLYDALVLQGVGEAQAHHLAQTTPPLHVVVAVAANGRFTEAVQAFRRWGGRVDPSMVE